MTLTAPILDLALKQVTDAAKADASPNKIAPVPLGKPRAFGDAMLGAATRFDGSSGLAMTLAGLPSAQAAFTVIFWLRVAPIAPANTGEVALLTLGNPATNALKLTLNAPWDDMTAGMRLAGVVSGKGTAAPDQRIQVSAWRNVALVRDGDTVTLYIDSRPAGSVDVKGLTLDSKDLTLGVALSGGNKNGLNGEMARVRMFTSALSVADLRDLMTTDMTARGRLDAALPLTVRMLDGAGEPNLYIEDHPGGGILTLEIQNVSTHVIHFVAGATSASRITLTFPAGALHPDVLALNGPTALQVRESERWSVAPPVTAMDGIVTVTITNSLQDIPLAPDEVVAITLVNVRAARGDGSRSCRVIFGFDGLNSDDPTFGDVSGERAKMLSIIDHTGSQFFPLAIDITHGARVLTGDPTASLTLILTNTATDRRIVFDPPAPDSAGQKHPVSALHVHLTPETLITPQFERLLRPGATGGTVKIAGWSSTLEGEHTADPVWVLTPDTRVELRAGGTLVINLTGLAISPLAGWSRIRVTHRGLPGFWYGEQTLIVERSPIVWTGPDRVGIGIHPDRALSIRGVQAVNRSELLGLHDFDGTVQWHINYINSQAVTPPGLNFAKSGVADFRLFLADSGGVGLNTGSPKGQLHVAGDSANAPTRVVVSSATGQHSALEVGPESAALARVSSDGTGMMVTTDQPTISVGAAAGGRLYMTRQNQALTTDDVRVAWNSNLVSVSPALQVLGPGGASAHIQFTTLGPQFVTDQSTIEVCASNIGILSVGGQGNPPSPYSIALYWNNQAVNVQENLNVMGSFSAKAKHFDIPHPLRADRRLVHASLESPSLDVSYRGTGMLRDGIATIVLPDYFEALTRQEGRTVHLTARGRIPFLLSYDDIMDGRFSVHGTAPDGGFSWEVRATRADLPPLIAEPEPRT